MIPLKSFTNKIFSILERLISQSSQHIGVAESVQLYYYFSLPIPFFSNIINNKET
jgi:hypothetical protein